VEVQAVALAKVQIHHPDLVRLVKATAAAMGLQVVEVTLVVVAVVLVRQEQSVLIDLVVGVELE
jgi:hypothetical protein